MRALDELVAGIDFGEGPRWHQGRLWYSDFYQHEVRAVDMHGNQEVMVSSEFLGERRPSGLGWLPDGSLLIVSMVEREVLRYVDGSLSLYADLSAIATGHCNDMVVDAAGRAYVGNFGFDLDSGADPVGASLALVQPDGAVSVAAEGLLFPNGSVITPDGATLIVGQTFASDFQAFDIDPANGSLSNQRQWAAIEGTAPDGCALDAQGAIWFADAFGKRCLRVAEGGEVLETINVGQSTYACMLGGDDGTTLFVLSSDGATPDECNGTATGKIRIVTVDSPRAGMP